MTPHPRPRLAAFEFCLVIGLCFGMPILNSLLNLAGHYEVTEPHIPSAAEGRAWLIGVIVFELVVAVPAAVILWWRGWRLADFPWRMGAVPTLAGIGLAFGSMMALAFVTGLLAGTGGNEVFAAMFMGTLPGIATIAAVSVVNGAFEEIFVLGYVIRFFERSGVSGWQNIAVAASTLIRLLYHTYQGPIFATGIALMGVSYALLYLRFRNLWIFAWAHMLWDFLAMLPGSEA